MALVERDGCIFDAEQHGLSHGYEDLDAVAREAFVNHIHLDSDDRVGEAHRIIEAWVAEMRSRWPDRTFRIYRHVEIDEVTIRFHVVRPDLPDWCESGVEIVTVGG